MKNLINNSATKDSPTLCSEESEESDCGSEENETAYNRAVHICSTGSLKKNVYVTNISATRDTNPKVAIASSDGILRVQSLSDNFFDSVELSSKLNHIVEVKFDKVNDNLLWSAIHNGSIDLWDLRIPNKAVSSFTDTSDSKEDKDKKFNSFDISSCGRLLCAGTNQFEEDAFIIFWDIRNSKLAGGFWESHVDDITQVKFHPNNSEKLFSASTDGLINVYDLSQSSEEDSLVDTLNTEASIEKISCTEVGSKTLINCITHTSDVQFWTEEGVQPDQSFSRDKIGACLKKSDYLYIVDVYTTKGSTYLLAGCGSKRVTGLKVDKSSLIPSFELFENQQRLKCSWYNENVQLLLTGGEKGVVDAWNLKNVLS